MFLVVDGATAQCSCGSVIGLLSSTAHVKVSSKSFLKSNNAQPFVNIPTFGFCSILNGPCIPSTRLWQNTLSLVQLNTDNVVTNESNLPCSIGGVISIVHPGQSQIKTK